MVKLIDVSTVVAASAGLWALAFGWLTYVKSVQTQNEDEFLALRSIAEGLRTELALMKGWTGAGGQGYSKTMTAKTAPAEWSHPDRLIWKFDIGAISDLTRSPCLYRLGDIIQPFARLNFSVSRLFQLYDEYRNFVNSDPNLALLYAGPGAMMQTAYPQKVFDFNFVMHVKLIGGADSDDSACLYKAYADAIAALADFDAKLTRKALPWWFWIGHFIASVCAFAGILLLLRLF